jgi:hypothetical protein
VSQEDEARVILDGGPVPQRLSRELTYELVRQTRRRLSDASARAGEASSDFAAAHVELVARLAEVDSLAAARSHQIEVLETRIAALETENLKLARELEELVSENRNLKAASLAAKGVKR